MDDVVSAASAALLPIVSRLSQNNDNQVNIEPGEI
jgi:hypothetical protein